RALDGAPSARHGVGRHHRRRRPGGRAPRDHPAPRVARGAPGLGLWHHRLMLGRWRFAWCLGTSLAIACGGESDVDGGSIDGGGGGGGGGPSRVAAGAAADGGPGDAAGGAEDDGGVVSVDAGPEDVGGGECGACIAETLRWELEGGFVAYQSANEVQPCRTYE